MPTPPELVETMLDLAKVTKDDFVIDLGSGDGRNVIAAAKRGARAPRRGVQPRHGGALDSRPHGRSGVADRATFVQGDMYEADISKATVMAIFLLPANMDKLLPKFQGLAPGTRIVAEHVWLQRLGSRRTRHREGRLRLVRGAALDRARPGRQAPGRIDMGMLALTQMNQVLYGSLTVGTGEAPIGKARMRGYDIAFTVGDHIYTGRVSGSTMQGTVSGPAGTRTGEATGYR